MEVLDLQGACEFLKLAKPTLYKYIRTGQIPAFKVGRVWRFHRNALDEWVRSRVSEDTQARIVKRGL
jgi:excisionase family DNA binding protein